MPDHFRAHKETSFQTGRAASGTPSAVRCNSCVIPVVGPLSPRPATDEAQILKCQIGISSSGHSGRRRSVPYAFTEEGVAKLSALHQSELLPGCEGSLRRTAARSVWSASSLLALWNGAACPKAGASSAHSKRFAHFGCGLAPLCSSRRCVSFLCVSPRSFASLR